MTLWPDQYEHQAQGLGLWTFQTVERGHTWRYYNVLIRFYNLSKRTSTNLSTFKNCTVWVRTTKEWWSHESSSPCPGHSTFQAPAGIGSAWTFHWPFVCWMCNTCHGLWGALWKCLNNLVSPPSIHNSLSFLEIIFYMIEVIISSNLNTKFFFGWCHILNIKAWQLRIPKQLKEWWIALF